MIPATFDRARYDALVARGMPTGLGDTEHACVMACLNLACGGGLTDADESPCVLPAAAKFAIHLNDANWSSPTARASGMHDLGLALLGTADIDRATFVRRLAEGTIRRVLPIALRAAGFAEHADRCEREGTRAAAAAAAADSYASAYAAAASSAYAAAASSYADAAAYAASAYAASAYADADTDYVLSVSATIATEILTEMRGAL